MDFKQNLIWDLMAEKFDGCVQIDETYDVESYESSCTVIFLDETYQNCAVSANSEEGWIKRCVLKPGAPKSPTLLQGEDVEWNKDADEPMYETVYGTVLILCCSPSILRLIQKLV